MHLPKSQPNSGKYNNDKTLDRLKICYGSIGFCIYLAILSYLCKQDLYLVNCILKTKYYYTKYSSVPWGLTLIPYIPLRYLPMPHKHIHNIDWAIYNFKSLYTTVHDGAYFWIMLRTLLEIEIKWCIVDLLTFGRSIISKLAVLKLWFILLVFNLCPRS